MTRGDAVGRAQESLEAISMKRCPKCNETKPLAEFGKDASRRDGLRTCCKSCDKAASASYRVANPEKVRAAVVKWAAANPEREKENKAKWRAANTDKNKERAAKWRAENPEKNKAIAARWRAANREALRIRGVKYRADNPSKSKASVSAWRAANQEKCKADNAAWNKENAEARRIINNNRRARKLANGGRLSPGLAAKLFKLQRGKCACCHVSIADENHLDHRIPVALGGPNEDWNMQLLCPLCNLSKGAKNPVDFMQSRGFLL